MPLPPPIQSNGGSECVTIKYTSFHSSLFPTVQSNDGSRKQFEAYRIECAVLTLPSTRPDGGSRKQSWETQLGKYVKMEHVVTMPPLNLI